MRIGKLLMMPGKTIVLNEQTFARDVKTRARVDAEFLEKLKLGDAEAFDNLVVLYIMFTSFYFA